MKYYGQIKIAFNFDDHQNAIFGGIKGLVTGGIIGGMRNIDAEEHKKKKQVKNVLMGSLMGGVAGTGLGSILDQESVKDQFRKIIDKDE